MNASLFRIQDGALGPATALSLEDCDPEAEKMVRKAMEVVSGGEPGAGFQEPSGASAVISIRTTKTKDEGMRYFCIGEELSRPLLIGFVVPQFDPERSHDSDAAAYAAVDWLLDLCLSASAHGQADGSDPPSHQEARMRLWDARPTIVLAALRPASSPANEKLVARLGKTMAILWYLDTIV